MLSDKKGRKKVAKTKMEDGEERGRASLMVFLPAAREFRREKSSRAKRKSVNPYLGFDWMLFSKGNKS